jgi:hypothetical protein
MNQHSGKKRANDDYSDRRIDTLNQLLLSVDMAGPGRTVCPVGARRLPRPTEKLGSGVEKPPGFGVGSGVEKPPGFGVGSGVGKPPGFGKPRSLNGGGAGVNPG